MTSSSYLIVGAHFRPPAKAILQVLPNDARLRLEPEPSNPYDANAIKVTLSPESLAEVYESFPEQHDTLRTLSLGFGVEIDDFVQDHIDSGDNIHLGYIPRGEAEKIVAQVPSEGLDANLTFSDEGKPAVRVTL